MEDIIFLSKLFLSFFAVITLGVLLIREMFCD
jgi:hypothetical protein